MASSDLLARSSRLVQANSPTILTALGVVGVVTTAVLTNRAATRASVILAHTPIDEQPLPMRTVVERVWTLYIPAVAMGALTITCIVGANRIGTRRTAAIASAFAISDRAFNEYRDKVVEQIGKKKEQIVHDAVAQERVSQNPSTDHQVVVTGNGDVLCYDQFLGRYFQSNMEALKKAQNDFNYQLLHEGYGSLTDFYRLVGLPSTSVTENLGWNSDNMLELMFTSVLSETDKPCIAMDFYKSPSTNYYKLY